jgi:hypothetical protein
MAEESPPDLPGGDGPSEDVLGQIDQLLNRHRQKPSPAEAIPVLTESAQNQGALPDDGIPLLTDVVTGTGSPAAAPSAAPRSSTLGSVLILRRMAIALDAEHIRLLRQLDGDAAQARMLDRLVAELKRALPAAVRAALAERMPDSTPPGDDGRI